MKHPLITLTLIIIMLSIIYKVLGVTKPLETAPLMPRQINLTGNIVHFAMPENFSRDMPAADMIETVNLADKAVYQDAAKFTLIRRWWDFKEGGWFGKEYGTLMMSLYVKEVPDSLTLDITDPMNFIEIIIDQINKHKTNDPMMVNSDYFGAYKERWFNNQRWLNYVQGHLNGNTMTILYAVPVSQRTYIVAEFTSAPANNIGMRYFIDTFTEPFMQQIMASFKIDYVAGNPVKDAVMKANSKIPLQQLIDEKIRLMEP